MITVEALSLGFWAGLAAVVCRPARTDALGFVAGLVMGGVVLLLELILQPGKAAS